MVIVHFSKIDNAKYRENLMGKKCWIDIDVCNKSILFLIDFNVRLSKRFKMWQNVDSLTPGMEPGPPGLGIP